MLSGNLDRRVLTPAINDDHFFVASQASYGVQGRVKLIRFI
ncbi:hypothetical protein NSND_50589 [Nitrospira sp. ND1]|nr:hypothetical protein NSND_50589 [Nitrospira sp. ND1]